MKYLLPPLFALSGCAWLSSANHTKDLARILACVSGEAAAGKTPGEIALTCGLENADAVLDLVSKAQGVSSAAPKMGAPKASK